MTTIELTGIIVLVLTFLLVLLTLVFANDLTSKTNQDNISYYSGTSYDF